MRPRNTLTTKVLLLLGLVVATVVLFLAPALGGEPQHAHAAGPYNIRSLLLTPNRDRLALCIQPVAGSGLAADEVRALVQTTLPRVATHQYWAVAGLAVAPPVVEVGCPSEPYLLRPGAAMAGAKEVGTADLPRVANASPYRVFVFILPEAQINAIFGVTASRAAVQELVRDGGQCGEVSTGLYLSPQELRDPQVLTGLLERAIGLEPRVPRQQGPSSR